MAADLGIRLKSPPHVGGFVKYEILAPLNLSVTDAAKALGVTRPALSALLMISHPKWHCALKRPLAFRWTR